MNKYPIYIVSKGRYKTPLTATFLKKDNVKFKILVEEEEYQLYCESVGKEYVMKLPFSNLGLGSFPARNYAWEDSIKNGYKRHWCFDDNIHEIRRFVKGKRIPCNAMKAIKILEDFTERYENVGISAFNYCKFVLPTTKKAFYLNVHAYSAMLILNDVPFRWRLKYNEDVDLCLQYLSNKYCTILLNAFSVKKVDTTAKMKGGNQTELYKGNSKDKKVLKARSLEEIWPQFAKTVFRFNRPHHCVKWHKYFTHPLIKRKGIGVSSSSNTFSLKAVRTIKSKELKKFLAQENKKDKR